MIEEYKSLLKQYVSFKSISADSSYSDEIKKTVNWLRELFAQHDFVIQVFEEYDNPIILASLEVDPSLDTVLIYGHYDVQPADIKDSWSNDPFDLAEKDQKLYARGVMDNKGQFLMHIVAIFELIKAGKLKYNVKFLAEGNEETGSPNIERFIQEQKEELKADLVMISDGSVVEDYPIIELGLRGLVNFELKFKTSHTDLHSGMYGSSAPNAIHELSKFVSKIYSDDNKIRIPEFFKDVDPIDPETREILNKIPFDIRSYHDISGTKSLLNEVENNFYIQTGLRPSIEITGLSGGYTGEGIKTIIPASATAKINIRIVKSQKIERVVELFERFVQENIPPYVEYEIHDIEGVEAVKLDKNNKYYEKVKDTLESVFQKELLNYYVGGTLPVIKFLQDYLSVPILSIPLGNQDANMHGIDENLGIIDIQKGIKFSREFFSKL